MSPQERNELLRRILPFGIGFVVILLVGVVIYFALQSNTLSITRLDEATKNIPEGNRAAIRRAVDLIITQNNPSKNTRDVNDIAVRPESIKQNYNEQQRGYTGSFIVDIESLKQSYRVQYSYSSNENSTLNSGYPVVASCLEASELKYGAFDCQDTSIEQHLDDPLLSKLPYEAPFYSVTNSQSESGEQIVIVKIMTNTNSSRTREAFARYKVEANAWIEQQGVKLSDYLVEYRNLSNHIVD